MTTLEIAALAARLLTTAAAVLLLPGLLALRAARIAPEWPDRVVLAFALSYSWVFILSIAVPAFGWNVDAAAALTLAATAALAIAAFRRGPARDYEHPGPEARGSGALLAAAVAVAALCGWVIEPAITGEEALDLASIARFADGGAITLDNTSLFPDTRAVYVVQPYQLAVATIARWSGTDPLVAYVKLRALFAPLTLIFLCALIRRLAPTRVDATAAFAVVLLFIGMDVATWESNSLFPLVRRGAIGAGLCVPALMVLCLAASRRAGTDAARATRRLALWVAPVMLVASLATHPLEMFTLLCFVAGVGAAAFTRLDRLADRRQAAMLLVVMVTAAVAYVFVQTRAVPFVAEYERDDKQVLRTQLEELLSDPRRAVLGGPTEARGLLTRTIPGTTATVIGIPAMAVAAMRAPAAAAILALGFVPLALTYATPAGSIILTLLTSVETVRDVNAYFALLGLLALALAVTAIAHALLDAAAGRHQPFSRVIATAFVLSIALWIAWEGGSAAIRSFAAGAVAWPELTLIVAVVTTAVVFVIAAARSGPIIGGAPFSAAVVVVALTVALPFVLPERAFGGAFSRRDAQALPERLRAALAAPSVLEWATYYDSLARSIAPPLPVPRAVVDELRRVLPPRQILLADPDYSCALVVLVNAYCVNPASIYGHYFQPAVPYFRTYVREGASGEPEHPIFNASHDLSDAEMALLAELPGAFVLVSPEYLEPASAKLGRAGATVVMEREGYRLFRLDAPGATTPAR